MAASSYPSPASQHLHLSRKFGFAMAVASAVFGALYLLGIVINLIASGRPYSTAAPVQLISALIAILWDISLLILFVALRWNVSEGKKFNAELALVFMALVTALSSVNWFAQLALAPRALQRGDTALLALIDAHSDGSIMFAMEHLGWGLFFGLATLFIASAFTKPGLEAWLRGLLAAAGFLSLLHVLGLVIASPILSSLGYVAWGVLLPVASVLLVVWFRRISLLGRA